MIWQISKLAMYAWASRGIAELGAPPETSLE